jgi:hypothetical protein
MESVTVWDGEFKGVYYRKIGLKQSVMDEMEAGYDRVRSQNTMFKVYFADEDQWAFVVGLVVCGLAEKVR